MPVKFFQVTGFILAGGASTRMGRDKALLELAGLPLLRRAAGLIEPLVSAVTVVGPPSKYAGLWPQILPDDAPGLGPLGGIVTALRASATEWSLIVSCDMPYLAPEWIEYLLARAVNCRGDAVMPLTTDEAGRPRPEPLCAVYHRRCLAPVRAAIERGVRKVTRALEGCIVEKVEAAEWKAFDSHGRLFKNMNSPEDYAAARAWFEQRNTS